MSQKISNMINDFVGGHDSDVCHLIAQILFGEVGFENIFGFQPMERKFVPSSSITADNEKHEKLREEIEREILRALIAYEYLIRLCPDTLRSFFLMTYGNASIPTKIPFLSGVCSPTRALAVDLREQLEQLIVQATPNYEDVARRTYCLVYAAGESAIPVMLKPGQYYIPGLLTRPAIKGAQESIHDECKENFYNNKGVTENGIWDLLSEPYVAVTTRVGIVSKAWGHFMGPILMT